MATIGQGRVSVSTKTAVTVSSPSTHTCESSTAKNNEFTVKLSHSFQLHTETLQNASTALQNKQGWTDRQKERIWFRVREDETVKVSI